MKPFTRGPQSGGRSRLSRQLLGAAVIIAATTCGGLAGVQAAVQGATQGSTDDRVLYISVAEAF